MNEVYRVSYTDYEDDMGEEPWVNALNELDSREINDAINTLLTEMIDDNRDHRIETFRDCESLIDARKAAAECAGTLTPEDFTRIERKQYYSKYRITAPIRIVMIDRITKDEDGEEEIETVETVGTKAR